MKNKNNICVLFSGPSGIGKSLLLSHLSTILGSMNVRADSVEGKEHMLEVYSEDWLKAVGFPKKGKK